MAYFNPEHPIPRLSRRPGAYNSRRNDGVDYYNLHVIPTNIPPPPPSYFMPYMQSDFTLVQEPLPPPPPAPPSRTVMFNQKKNKTRTRSNTRPNLIDLSKSSTASAGTFKAYSPNTAVDIIETEVNPVKEVIESKSPYKYQHHAEVRLKSESPYKYQHHAEVRLKSESPRYHPEPRSSSRLDSPRHAKTSREEHESKFYSKYYESSRSHRKNDKYKDRGDWDARELHLSGKNTSKRYQRKNSSPRKKKEALEDVSDTALEETDFEEVEVASLEESKSEVPVGFRKCKVKYLPCKKDTFFKPKIYYICSERTVINCSNWQEDEWKEQEEEVDVVSEEDYEMETEVVVEEQTTDTAIVEEQTSDAAIVEEQTSDAAIVEEQTTDAAIVEESLPVMESDNIETKSSEIPKETDSTSKNLKKEVENKEDELKKFVSTRRSYRRCITDHDEFYQGEAIIQSDIDAWKSHLIGLGYILEVREATDDTNVLKHHCILCSDNIHAENDSGEMVINHITSYRHMFKYLCCHITAEN